MAADWDLSGCCNTGQIIFCCCFAGFLVLNALLWRFSFLKPMKFIAVFVHEMSHAIACWFTGGRVKAIQVFDNEGGVTKYVGGVQTLVIPAGYLGCAFWGMVFVTLSGDVIAATVAACMFVVALFAALFYSPNKFMVFLNLGFIAVTVACILMQWLIPFLSTAAVPLISLVVLYYGVFIGSFGIYDIYDDLITRTVEGSDSHACYQLYPCCLPRCVGCIWAVMAFCFMGAGVYFALIWLGA